MAARACGALYRWGPEPLVLSFGIAIADHFLAIRARSDCDNDFDPFAIAFASVILEIPNFRAVCPRKGL